MFKALLQLANFTLGPDATHNTEIPIPKNSVRIKDPISVNASKRKHKNQMYHYNKQRRVLMANLDNNLQLDTDFRKAFDSVPHKRLIRFP